jgi:hypothetical protein
MRLKKRRERPSRPRGPARDLPRSAVAARAGSHSREKRQRNPQAAFADAAAGHAKCRTGALFSRQTFWLQRAISLDKIGRIGHLLK